MAAISSERKRQGRSSGMRTRVIAFIVILTLLSISPTDGARGKFASKTKTKTKAHSRHKSPRNMPYLGNYHCVPGRDVMVQLFEWKWRDVGRECRSFLHSNGFCAVQVSSPMEHRIVKSPRHPWWERYQPVSYLINSRSGDIKDFIFMLIDCNSVGVRVYVDAVINHMAGAGSGRGWARSPWSGDEGYFPEVPYDPRSFHRRRDCPTKDMGIHNYSNPKEVRNCQLMGLKDLNLSKKYVRRKVTAFLNKLIDLGVAGFRIDAAKLMWPKQLQAIYQRLHKLHTGWFPAHTMPFIYQEVIDLGREPITAGDYAHMGRVTEFRYGQQLAEVIQKVNGRRLAHLQNYGEKWGFSLNKSAIVFTDNHDTQRNSILPTLSFREETQYKIANTFMLAWPYGYVRLMSSYFWGRKMVAGKDVNSWMGPPADFTKRRRPRTLDVECSSDQWVCEHRWPVITNMVHFHNVALGEPVTKWWDNDFHAVAFARGSRGFVIINNELFPLDRWFDTGLPAGQYCDVIHCTTPHPPCVPHDHHGNSTEAGATAGACQTLTVKEDGWLHAVVPSGSDPMVAIHV